MMMENDIVGYVLNISFKPFEPYNQKNGHAQFLSADFCKFFFYEMEAWYRWPCWKGANEFHGTQINIFFCNLRVKNLELFVKNLLLGG